MAGPDDSQAPDTGHSQGCVCGDGWRFEFTELSTGRVKKVAHPMSVTWEDNYTSPGVGSMVIATKDYSANDVWPNTTGIYISRVQQDGTRVAHFGGYVEKFDGSAGGATTLGLKSIDSYLFRRLLADDNEGISYTATDIRQTRIATDLVNYATPKGIPLIPVKGVGTRNRTRSWNYWEFKNIGEAITELVNAAQDGLRYHLEHEFSDGGAFGQTWVTRMIFTDQWGTDRPEVVLRSDREGWDYSLTVDGSKETSRAYGVGAGDGANQMYSIAFDKQALLPELQDSPAWKDIKDPTALDDQTKGFIANQRDPIATPEMTIAGLDPDPAITQPGDTVTVQIYYGLITFDGTAQILSVVWELGTDGPVTRTFAFNPTIRPSQGIKVQVPAVAPAPPIKVDNQIVPPSSAVPVAGLVTKFTDPSLNEVSGMQYSRRVINAVWVNNDENGPIRLVKVFGPNKGQTVSSFTPSQGPFEDPESLRIHPDGRLFLADIGDNVPDRTDRYLYAVPEPVKGVSGTVAAQKFPVSYPAGESINAEALLIRPTTGEFIIITKESGGGRAFSFGTGTAPASTGTLVASGLTNNVSDGTFTTNGKFMLLTRADRPVVSVYRYSDWAKVGTITIPSMSKCEAITVEGPCSFLVTSEGVGAPIYRVLIPNEFGANCSSGGGGTYDPTIVPGQVLDLSNWKLTLPI
jgi:hypothetical protein